MASNNTINYAERWQPELLEIMTQNALCGPFVTTNVRWLDARTFHFTQMSVSGYKAGRRMEPRQGHPDRQELHRQP